MFTTLYRDNYNRVSGCAGEGCGSHAGVDIAVASGTPVRAALPGIIITARCDTTSGFGGLVIIEADNPYAPGKVYLVYSHLDNWSRFPVGSPVLEGEVIGNSGGDPINGVCPGGSSGAHLHFQIDKNPPDAQGRPWFPKKLWPTEGAEHKDTNYDVLDYTHNPLPFVMGYAYNFTFAEDGNKEQWGAKNVSNYYVSGSSLRVDSSSTAPYVGRGNDFGTASCGEGAPCSREIIVDADIFGRLALNLNFACFSNPFIVYFRRGPSDTWHGGAFNYSIAGTYTLEMSGHPQWYGIITDLRIKLSSGCTATPGPEEYRINQAYFLQ